ncbi:hypothetical protein QJQ45_030180 [Haematococcus lacustris]|nr:hypothetical protein QJQ45_030180 [Haematococcus lacustris]
MRQYDPAPRPKQDLEQLVSAVKELPFLSCSSQVQQTSQLLWCFADWARQPENSRARMTQAQCNAVMALLQCMAVGATAGKAGIPPAPPPLQQFDARQLSMAAWSLGKLKPYPPPAAVTSAYTALARHSASSEAMKRGNWRDWSTLLHGLATAGMQCKNSPDLTRLCDQAVQLLPDKLALGAVGQDISMTLWAMAKLGYTGSAQPLLQSVTAAISQGGVMRDAKPQAWANLIWATSKLPGCREEARQLLDQFAARAQAVVPGLDARSISNILYAMGMLLWHHKEVCMQLAERAAQTQQAVNGQDLANSLYGLARLGYLDSSVHSLAAEVAKADLAAFTTQAITNLLYARSMFLALSIHQAVSSGHSQLASEPQLNSMAAALWRECSRRGKGHEQLAELEYTQLCAASQWLHACTGGQISLAATPALQQLVAKAAAFEISSIKKVQNAVRQLDCCQLVQALAAAGYGEPQQASLSQVGTFCALLRVGMELGLTRGISVDQTSHTMRDGSMSGVVAHVKLQQVTHFDAGVVVNKAVFDQLASDSERAAFMREQVQASLPEAEAWRQLLQAGGGHCAGQVEAPAAATPAAQQQQAVSVPAGQQARQQGALPLPAAQAKSAGALPSQRAGQAPELMPRPVRFKRVARTVQVEISRKLRSDEAVIRKCALRQYDSPPQPQQDMWELIIAVMKLPYLDNSKKVEQTSQLLWRPADWARQSENSRAHMTQIKSISVCELLQHMAGEGGAGTAGNPPAPLEQVDARRLSKAAWSLGKLKPHLPAAAVPSRPGHSIGSGYQLGGHLRSPAPRTCLLPWLPSIPWRTLSSSAHNLRQYDPPPRPKQDLEQLVSAVEELPFLSRSSQVQQTSQLLWRFADWARQPENSRARMIQAERNAVITLLRHMAGGAGSGKVGNPPASPPLQQFNARQLSKAAWSLGKLKPHLPAAAVTSACTAIASHSASSETMEEGWLAGAVDQAISMTLWAMAKSGYTGSAHTLLQSVTAAISQGGVMRDAKPQAWANLIWATSKLPDCRAEARQLLDLFAIRGIRVVADVKAQEVSNILYAISLVLWHDKEVCRQLAERAVLTQRTMTSQELANSLYGLARLGYLDSSVRSLAAAVAKADLAAFKPQELANLLYARSMFLALSIHQAVSSGHSQLASEPQLNSMAAALWRECSTRGQGEGHWSEENLTQLYKASQWLHACTGGQISLAASPALQELLAKATTNERQRLTHLHSAYKRYDCQHLLKALAAAGHAKVQQAAFSQSGTCCARLLVQGPGLTLGIAVSQSNEFLPDGSMSGVMAHVKLHQMTHFDAGVMVNDAAFDRLASDSERAAFVREQVRASLPEAEAWRQLLQAGGGHGAGQAEAPAAATPAAQQQQAVSVSAGKQARQQGALPLPAAQAKSAGALPSQRAGQAPGLMPRPVRPKLQQASPAAAPPSATAVALDCCQVVVHVVNHGPHQATWRQLIEAVQESLRQYDPAPRPKQDLEQLVSAVEELPFLSSSSQVEQTSQLLWCFADWARQPENSRARMTQTQRNAMLALLQRIAGEARAGKPPALPPLQQFTARQFDMAAWSLGKLKPHLPPAAVTSACTALARHSASSEPLERGGWREWSNLLHGLATAGMQCSDSPDLTWLCDQAVQLLPERLAWGVASQDISMTLWAMAKSGYTGSAQPLLQSVTAATSQGEVTRDAKPQEWANLIWAASKLPGCREEARQLLSLFAARAQAVVASMKAQEVSNILYAMGQVLWHDKEVCRQLAERAARVQQTMKSQNMANSLYGLARLGYLDSSVHSLAAGVAKADLTVFEPQHLANLLYARSIFLALSIHQAVSTGHSQLASEPQLNSMAAALWRECSRRGQSEEQWALAAAGYEESQQASLSQVGTYCALLRVEMEQGFTRGIAVVQTPHFLPDGSLSGVVAHVKLQQMTHFDAGVIVNEADFDQLASDSEWAAFMPLRQYEQAPQPKQDMGKLILAMMTLPYLDNSKKAQQTSQRILWRSADWAMQPENSRACLTKPKSISVLELLQQMAGEPWSGTAGSPPAPLEQFDARQLSKAAWSLGKLKPHLPAAAAVTPRPGHCSGCGYQLGGHLRSPAPRTCLLPWLPSIPSRTLSSSAHTLRQYDPAPRPKQDLEELVSGVEELPFLSSSSQVEQTSQLLWCFADWARQPENSRARMTQAQCNAVLDLLQHMAGEAKAGTAGKPPALPPLQQFDARQLNMAAWSLGKLRPHLPPAAVTSACTALASHSASSEAMKRGGWRDWGNLLHGLATAGMQCSSSPDLTRLCDQAVQLLPEKLARGAAAQDISMTLWGMAKSGYTGNAQPLLQSVTAAISQGEVMSDAKPQNWANLIWATSKLPDCREEARQLLDQFANRGRRVVAGCNAQNLSNIMYAIGMLLWHDKEVCRQLAERAAQTQQTMSEQNMANSLYGLARLGYLDSSVRSLAAGVAKADLTVFKPQELANLLYARSMFLALSLHQAVSSGHSQLASEPQLNSMAAALWRECSRRGQGEGQWSEENLNQLYTASQWLHACTGGQISLAASPTLQELLARAKSYQKNTIFKLQTVFKSDRSQLVQALAAAGHADVKQASLSQDGTHCTQLLVRGLGLTRGISVDQSPNLLIEGSMSGVVAHAKLHQLTHFDAGVVVNKAVFDQLASDSERAAFMRDQVRASLPEAKAWRKLLQAEGDTEQARCRRAPITTGRPGTRAAAPPSAAEALRQYDLAPRPKQDLTKLVSAVEELPFLSSKSQVEQTSQLLWCFADWVKQPENSNARMTQAQRNALTPHLPAAAVTSACTAIARHGASSKAMERAGWREWSILLHGLATAGMQCSSSPDLTRLCDQAVQLLPDKLARGAADQAISMTLWAMAKSGYTGSAQPLLQSVTAAISQGLVQPDLGYQQAAWLQGRGKAAAERAVQTQQTMSEQNMANSLYGLARLGYLDSSVRSLAAGVAKADLTAFKPQELAKLLYARSMFLALSIHQAVSSGHSQLASEPQLNSMAAALWRECSRRGLGEGQWGEKSLIQLYTASQWLHACSGGQIPLAASPALQELVAKAKTYQKDTIVKLQTVFKSDRSQLVQALVAAGHAEVQQAVISQDALQELVAKAAACKWSIVDKLQTALKKDYSQLVQALAAAGHAEVQQAVISQDGTQCTQLLLTGPGLTRGISVEQSLNYMPDGSMSGVVAHVKLQQATHFDAGMVVNKAVFDQLASDSEQAAFMREQVRASLPEAEAWRQLLQAEGRHCAGQVEAPAAAPPAAQQQQAVSVSVYGGTAVPNTEGQVVIVQGSGMGPAPRQYDRPPRPKQDLEQLMSAVKELPFLSSSSQVEQTSQLMWCFADWAKQSENSRAHMTQAQCNAVIALLQHMAVGATAGTAGNPPALPPLQQYNARQLSMAAWSLGKLQPHLHFAAVTSACTALASHSVSSKTMRRGGWREWSNLLHGLATAGMQCSSSPDLTRLCNQAVQLLPVVLARGAVGQDISMTLLAMVKSGYTGNAQPLLQSVSAAISQGEVMRDAKPQAWANLIWATSKLPDCREEARQLLSLFAARAQSLYQYLKAVDISNIFYSMSLVLWHDKEVCRQLAERAVPIQRTMKSQEMANSLYGLARLGYLDSSVRSLAAGVAKAELTAFNSQDLANLLYARSMFLALSIHQAVSSGHSQLASEPQLNSMAAALWRECSRRGQEGVGQWSETEYTQLHTASQWLHACTGGQISLAASPTLQELLAKAAAIVISNVKNKQSAARQVECDQLVQALAAAGCFEPKQASLSQVGTFCALLRVGMDLGLTRGIAVNQSSLTLHDGSMSGVVAHIKLQQLTHFDAGVVVNMTVFDQLASDSERTAFMREQVRASLPEAEAWRQLLQAGGGHCAGQVEAPAAATPASQQQQAASVSAGQQARQQGALPLPAAQAKSAGTLPSQRAGQAPRLMPRPVRPKPTACAVSLTSARKLCGGQAVVCRHVIPGVTYSIPSLRRFPQCAHFCMRSPARHDLGIASAGVSGRLSSSAALRRALAACPGFPSRRHGHSARQHTVSDAACWPHPLPYDPPPRPKQDLEQLVSAVKELPFLGSSSQVEQTSQLLWCFADWARQPENSRTRMTQAQCNAVLDLLQRIDGGASDETAGKPPPLPPLQQFDARQLDMAAWSLGKLRPHLPPAAVTSACTAIASHSASSEAMKRGGWREWSNLLHGLATAGMQCSSSPDLTWLCNQAVQLLPGKLARGAVGQDISMTLWAMAKSGYTGSAQPLLQSVTAAISQGGVMRDAKAQAWANLIWATSKMPGCREEARQLLSLFAARAQAVVPGLQAQSISNILYAMSLVLWHDKEVCRQLADRALLTQRTMKSQDMANSLYGLARLGYLDSSVRSLAAGVAKADLAAFEPQHLANLLYARSMFLALSIHQAMSSGHSQLASEPQLNSMAAALWRECSRRGQVGGLWNEVLVLGPGLTLGIAVDQASHFLHDGSMSGVVAHVKLQQLALFDAGVVVNNAVFDQLASDSERAAFMREQVRASLPEAEAWRQLLQAEGRHCAGQVEAAAAATPAAQQQQAVSVSAGQQARQQGALPLPGAQAKSAGVLPSQRAGQAPGLMPRPVRPKVGKAVGLWAALCGASPVVHTDSLVNGRCIDLDVLVSAAISVMAVAD